MLQSVLLQSPHTRVSDNPIYRDGWLDFDGSRRIKPMVAVHRIVVAESRKKSIPNDIILYSAVSYKGYCRACSTTNGASRPHKTSESDQELFRATLPTPTRYSTSNASETSLFLLTTMSTYETPVKAKNLNEIDDSVAAMVACVLQEQLASGNCLRALETPRLALGLPGPQYVDEQLQG